LARDAERLILDEPTAGLDPLMEAVFRECVDDERQHGRTVLLSSHILAEAEALADRGTIIRDGRTAETGTLAERRHLTRTTGDAELNPPVLLDGRPPAWGYVATAALASTSYSLNKLYPPAAARADLAASGGRNPALVFLYGRLWGDSLGAVSAWRYGVWAAIFAALMSVFLVVRHT